MTVAEYRKRLKAAHLCRECKKVDAYTLGGRTMCAECAERHAARERARRAAHIEDERAHKNEYRHQQRQQRREAGLCSQCGRRMYDWHAMCGRCRMIKARRSAEWRAAQ